MKEAKGSAQLVRQKLAQIDDLAENNRLLSPKLFQALNQKFQGRYNKVFDMLLDRAVLKYVFKPSDRVVWIVRGRERDYLIMPGAPYCHCTNFYIHVVNGDARVCAHLVAQRVAHKLNIHRTINEHDNNYPMLVNEWNQVRQNLKELPE